MVAYESNSRNEAARAFHIEKAAWREVADGRPYTGKLLAT